MISALKDPIQQFIAEHISPRYQQLESREQTIVMAAAIILPLLIMVFGWMLPLNDSQKALHKELILAQTQAIEADQLATYLLAHAADPTSNSGTSNLLTSVEQLARQQHIRQFISRIKPQRSLKNNKQSLMLRLKNVPYDHILRFIHALAEKGLNLKTLKLQTSKTPGIVQAHIIISQ